MKDGIDKQGDTIDFMLSEKRDCKLALKFLKKAIGLSGLSEKVTIDKSGANTAALHRLNLLLSELCRYLVEVRLIKYLNNIVKQDYRRIKRVTKYNTGFKSFTSAQATIAEIELHHMLKKDR